MTDNRSDSFHYRPWLKGLGCLHRKFARYWRRQQSESGTENVRLSKAVFLSEMRSIFEISRLVRVRKEFIKVAPENFAIPERYGCRYAKYCAKSSAK